MKRLIMAFALIVIHINAFAQKEQDFATRFMEMNSEEFKELTCNTVSPYMMERIMSLDTLAGNQDMRRVLSQLKSIQIVKAIGNEVGDSLFNRAINLAELNKKRYKLYTSDEERQIYLRTRNKIIVEMVFIAKIDNIFNIVNLTGNMNKSFLKELTEM